MSSLAVVLECFERWQQLKYQQMGVCYHHQLANIMDVGKGFVSAFTEQGPVCLL